METSEHFFLKFASLIKFSDFANGKEYHSYNNYVIVLKHTLHLVREFLQEHVI